MNTLEKLFMVYQVITTVCLRDMCLIVNDVRDNKFDDKLFECQ